MEAQVIDFVRRRGDTAPDKLIIKNKTTQAVTDITGFQFKMTVHSAQDPVDETTQLYQLTGTITDAVNGKVEFEPTEIQADRVGEFYFDIEQLDAAGKKLTIVVGGYEYKQDYTKT